MGDSWGTVSPATEHFQKELKEHNCPLDGFTNIAVGGTTAKQWSGTLKMLEVKKQAKDHDLVWVTLMGNDALEEMPIRVIVTVDGQSGQGGHRRGHG